MEERQEKMNEAVCYLVFWESLKLAPSNHFSKYVLVVIYLLYYKLLVLPAFSMLFPVNDHYKDSIVYF